MSNHTEKPPQAMQWISFSSHCLRYYILLSPTLLSVFSQLAKLENILQESANNKRKMFSSLERGARRLPSITKRRCMIRNFLTTWMSSLLSVFSLPPHERMSHEKWHHQLNSRERMSYWVESVPNSNSRCLKIFLTLNRNLSINVANIPCKTKEPPQPPLEWLSHLVGSKRERIYERWRMWIENWL